MSSRWVLNRAGIVNVYQYGEETLHFGGGRLLLRGVNGSGKSTAMNMLLPFLLEADTRRIDAAGEQSGVLRSWMLSGRDEQQPVGYLWLELRRDAEHLTIGCGIRANRSTDRVNTWWFVTSRRPGVDLSLVELRTPLSRDALKAVLGADPVFGHDQRRDYRAEVRNRLYGGSDIDQHLRLVHIVRSPRVGDRIDVDLPGYLEDALPQLSEAALDDAAQPLEDLEEHRRNVEQLSRTADVLDGLEVVYRSYACTELHRRATDLLGLVEEHRRKQSVETRARRDLETAEAENSAARQMVADLEATQKRLGEEIDALEDRDAYKAGADLEDLRALVGALEGQVTSGEARLGRAADRRLKTLRQITAQQRASDQELKDVHGRLADLAALATEVGLTVSPPTGIRIDVEDIEPSGSGGVTVPVGPLDVDEARRQLADVRAAARAREQDVHDIRKALAEVEAAEHKLTVAEQSLDLARGAETRADEEHRAKRTEGDRAVEAWRDALRDWIGRLDEHRTANGLAPAGFPLLEGEDLAGRRDEIVEALRGAAQGAVDHHLQVRAKLQARAETEQRTASELEGRLAELNARELPAPPVTTWQRDDRSACLAELIDFQDDVDPAARAGLEAAMEAASLLGAELSADGSLRLADGQLVARPGSPVGQSLSTMLMATIPAELRGDISPELVISVLDSLSVAPEDLDNSSEHPVVTVDGRFRLGVLRGRHHKAEAEHIGVTARRTALERQRADVARQVDEARSTVAATEKELQARTSLVDEATALRRRLPPTDPVDKALVSVIQAERLLADAREQHGQQRALHRSAEEAHAAAVDLHQRLAATLRLPADRESLHSLTSRLGIVRPQCDTLDAGLRNLARAVNQWIEAGRAWAAAVTDESQERADLEKAIADRDEKALRLATLEDSFGVEYEEIKKALELSHSDLRQAEADLGTARERHLEANGMVERCAEKLETATRDQEALASDCVAALPGMRQTLGVSGLLASALMTSQVAPDGVKPSDGDRKSPAGSANEVTAISGLPVVPDTPAGARQLARAVQETVPVPDPGHGPTQPEGLRQSLRQRRDALGAGWDAEDRQPDESLPIHVEVTGPLGRMPLPEAARRARAQLRQMESLLTAKQQQALRNLLEGLVAREVATKLHAARELVNLMNERLDSVITSHGIGVSLRWERRDDLDPSLAGTIGLLAKPPDLRTPDEDAELTNVLSARMADARNEDPEAPYRDLIARVMDYRSWHRMSILLRRPGTSVERLTRRTALSEGEKKIVSYLPLFAAVAASCDALGEREPAAPRFVLLDDAFAKVSEDNHAKLFGLLVELDLDFIATSERLWGTHASVPELAITEVVRDADLGIIVLEHARWDGRRQTQVA